MLEFGNLHILHWRCALAVVYKVTISAKGISTAYLGARELSKLSWWALGGKLPSLACVCATSNMYLIHALGACSIGRLQKVLTIIAVKRGVRTVRWMDHMVNILSVTLCC